ncbi:MAG: hypothetical protein NC120_11940, partial [Ruminococcus sp.]|nr:hypothetical protein [Ruminococcus sp.]
MQSVKEIKQTLLEARAAGLKYIELRNKARTYEQRLMSGKTVRYESDGSFHKRNGNSVERSLCAAADYSAEADRAAKELSEPYIKAARLIFLVKDDRLRSVLDRYYLHCQSWGRIAREMDISYRHVTRLHG